MRNKSIFTIIALSISFATVSWYYVKKNQLAIRGIETTGKITEALYNEIEESNPEDGYYHYAGFDVTYSFTVQNEKFENTTFINKKFFGIIEADLYSDEDFEEHGAALLIGKNVRVKYLSGAPNVNSLAFQSKFKISIWDIVINGVLIFIATNFIKGILLLIFNVD